MSIRAAVVVAALVVAGAPTALGYAAPASGAPLPVAVPAATGQVRTADPEPPSIDEIPVVVSPPEADASARRAAPEGSAAEAEPEPEPDPEAEDRALTAEIPVIDRQSLGVTWADPAATADVEVRVLTAEGWSDWVELGDESTAPDTGTAESTRTLRGGTGSVWIGDADAVQLSFPAAGAPADARLALIGSGTVDDEPAVAQQLEPTVMARADASVSATAQIQAAVAAPRVISRAEWGAAPQVCAPDVASTLVAAVVHHTAGPNTYNSVPEAMAQIRNDQRYHQQSRGWCDIGYNFLVDKWGNVYEGRANSSTQPVIGVHAGGFNTRTVGISLLGDYSSITPSSAVQETVARVIAWRLSTYYRDPGSTTTYTTLGGENSRYPAGTTLSLPVVLGHRDVAVTACPGQLGYSTLGWLRARAQQMVSPSFINPAPSATSVTRGAAVEVRAGALGDLDWTFTVTDARTGVRVARSTGFTPSRSGIVARWDGRGPAGVVGAGSYRLLLEGTGRAGGTATAWATNVEVTGSSNPPIVKPVPLGANLRFVPITPQRIADTRTTVTALGAGGRMDVKVTGVAGVPAGAKAVALNLTAVHASTRTHLRAWPAGLGRPAASVLNTDPARTVAAHVVLGVGGEGKVSVYNDTGSVHVAVDISGYYMTSGGTAFHALATPARLLDTRSSGSRLTSGAVRTVKVAGTVGIPAGATAAVVNVTSVGADAAGYLAALPRGSTTVSASTVNHRPGGDATNRATVTLSPDGAIDVRNAGGNADVVVDVVGWYSPGTGAVFTPIQPKRAFDTRTAGAPLGAGQVKDFAVGTAAGVPAGATSVVLNVTATQQTAWATFVTTWSGTGTRPATSDLNTGSGRDEANLAIVRRSSAATIRAYNNRGSTHLVGDVFGYFR